MTDRLQRDVDRGHRAKNLLDDSLFTEAREHIEAEIFRKFSEVRPDDTEALLHIKGIQYLHTKYLAYLKRVIQDGKVAQMEIERESKLKRAFRKVVG